MNSLASDKHALYIKHSGNFQVISCFIYTQCHYSWLLIRFLLVDYIIFHPGSFSPNFSYNDDWQSQKDESVNALVLLAAPLKHECQLKKHLSTSNNTSLHTTLSLSLINLKLQTHVDCIDWTVNRFRTSHRYMASIHSTKFCTAYIVEGWSLSWLT